MPVDDGGKLVAHPRAVESQGRAREDDIFLADGGKLALRLILIDQVAALAAEALFHPVADGEENLLRRERVVRQFFLENDLSVCQRDSALQVFLFVLSLKPEREEKQKKENILHCSTF